MAKIRFAASADRHLIAHADAEEAVRNPHFWIRQFDEPRAPGLARPDLFIGPNRPGAQQLEVMGNWLVGGDLELFHVMLLRQRTRERVREFYDRQ